MKNSVTGIVFLVVLSLASGNSTARDKLAANNADAAPTLPEISVTAPAEDREYATYSTTTATKTDTPIMQTPASIQVVPRAVLDDQQVIRVEDALKNISGVQTTDSFYDTFNIRGFDTNSSTFRNGLRVEEISFLETANLSQIEVLKGPAAVLFGRTEPGGLVNLVTKRPLETPYYSLQQQFGNYDLYRTTVDATGPILKDRSLLYRFNLAYKNNNSFRDFVSQEHIFVAPSLTWRPNQRFEANLDLEYQHDSFIYDTGIPAVGHRPAHLPISFFVGDGIALRNHPNSQDKILVGFNWTYHVNDNWRVTNRFHYVDASYHQTGLFFFGGFLDDGHTLASGNGRTGALWNNPLHRSSYAVNLDVNGKFTTGLLKHNVLVGFDYYGNYEHDGPGHIGPWDGNPTFDILAPRYGVVDLSAANLPANNFYYDWYDSWFGVYFQDQITLWDKLHLLGGGRYDWATQGNGQSDTGFGDIVLSKSRDQHFSPRVGLLYQATPWLSLYGNYIESFNANANLGRSRTNRPFGPETATEYEVGAKTAFFDQRLISSLAFYNLTKQNVLSPDPVDNTFSITTGEIRSRGVEFDITGHLTESLSLIGSYAYTDTEITKDNNGNVGHRLRNAARHSGSLWGRYELMHGPLRGLSFGTGVYVRGQRQGDNENTFQLPGYARWDASLGYSFKQFGSKITAQLNVYNLLDHRYYASSGGPITIHPGEPLTLLGSVRVEF